MAQYQIPQFLDSGDKILGPLNLRQFGYVLGGGIGMLIVYSIMNAVVPSLGIVNIIVAAPPLLFAVFLALGKYNGRDVEVYVTKFLIFNLRPKQLVFKRIPETYDLEQKLSKLSEAAIQKEWNLRLEEERAAKSKVGNFRNINAQQKAQRIRDISFNIDTSVRNTLAEVKAKEIQIEESKHHIGVLTNIKNKNRNYSQSPVIQEAPAPLQQTDSKADEINFFE